MPAAIPPPSRLAAGLRLLLRLAVLAALTYGGVVFCERVIDMVKSLPEASQGPMMIGLLVATLAAYAVLLAVPFVPGIEIGVMLLVMRGADIAVFVYVATLFGLSLAFTVGRYVPEGWLRRLALDLRLQSVANLLDRVAPLSQARRLALFRRRLPNPIASYVVRCRYIAFGVLLNMPGNAVLGGGGGICLIAGFTRLFSTKAAILTIALAVAPVPLAVWYFGLDFWGATPAG